jgi:predicted nuclease with TOPRIM domain|tara:strand:+ start:91 stop:375 length:285 start_codon:yes stop_codon:yes gene_type:complete
MAKKSKEIKFTKDEISQIESIRNGFDEVQNFLGRLEIQRIQAEQVLENLHNDKLRLETRYSDLVDEERELVANLNEKYGPGNLDPETGIFTPTK